ncbi:hypothetical protein DRO32_00730, partial [Candidatus Bathyarchaeota archaeon]
MSMASPEAELRIAGSSLRISELEVRLRANDVGRLRASTPFGDGSSFSLGDDVEAYVGGSLIFRGRLSGKRELVQGPDRTLVLEALD